MTVRIAILVTVLASVTACADPAPRSVPGWAEGRWRVGLAVPGGELPFFMEVSRSDDKLSAALINGDERVETRNVGVLGNRLVVDFSVFNSRIDASLEESGLVGTLSIVRQGGRPQVIPLIAKRGVATRFADSGAEPAIDVTGRWEVAFRGTAGEATPAIGEFVQAGSVLHGTFLTPTGDYRYLAGDVRGNQIRLSCFDGYHAFLFHAEVDAQGVMRGDFWSGTHWHETWTAARNANARLPDPDTLTFLKPGFDRLNFSFPDTTGSLVSFSDETYDDKVVLVAISGTWCPNCHDEAKLLRELYRDYHRRGLEVVTLMYEHVDDFDRAAAQVREFRRWHNLPYQLLVAGSSDKTEASKTLPMLNHVLAYPTTIFVDRRRHVRKIHTGFAGPGTGRHYDELAREYRDYIKFLLAEPVAQTVQ